MVASSAESGSFDPDSIGRRDFTTTFRGFDQVEVRGFLNQIGAELRVARDREADLLRRLEEAEARADAAEEPDEHRLTALLGEETARILDAARDAAQEIRSKAETKTAQLVRDAQAEANKMTSEAGELLRLRTTEAEAAAETIRSDAQAEYDRLVNDATVEAERIVAEATDEAARLRSEAEEEAARRSGEAEVALAQAEGEAAEMVEAARSEGRQMVTEAQVVRERILTDLARRRKAARAQLEQLRAARERLLEAYAVVRRTVDEATTELTVAVPEARLAAESAARRAEAEAEDLSVEAIEAELDAGRFAGLPLLDVGPAEAAAADGAQPESGPEPEPQPEVVAADEPEPAAISEPEPEPEVAEAVASPADDSAVHGIFARLRAEVPMDDPAEADAETSEVVVAAVAFDVEAESLEETNAEDHDEVDDEDREETVLERRDRYTVPLEQQLTRSLKRHLADDENEKLDLIRRRGPRDGVDVVLGDLAEHRATYIDGLREHLLAASVAGTDFAAEMLADRDEDPAPVTLVPIDDLVDELVDSLVIPIREKVYDQVDGAEGDDALDGVRASYRQWRSRSGDMASQFVHTAFNRGVFAAVPEASLVSWVVDDGAGPCPDGEDDALGGAIVKGDEFPTGHLHPPAHAGCRCLLVPGVL